MEILESLRCQRESKSHSIDYEGNDVTKRNVNGKPTSLCDLGYCDVGLDDNWQECDSPDAAPGMHYHDVDGNPIVNKDRFPSFKNMTDYAHSLGLTWMVW